MGETSTFLGISCGIMGLMGLMMDNVFLVISQNFSVERRVVITETVHVLPDSIVRTLPMWKIPLASAFASRRSCLPQSLLCAFEAFEPNPQAAFGQGVENPKVFQGPAPLLQAPNRSRRRRSILFHPRSGLPLYSCFVTGWTWQYLQSSPFEHPPVLVRY